MEELIKKCKDLKVIVSVVDGVITDGLIPIDELQNTLFKNYCLRDFEVINEIKKMFKFIFISSDNSVSYNLFRARNIPFYYAPKDKVRVLTDIMRKYGVKPDNIMYVGTSYSDLECMHLSEVSFCTKDSPVTVNHAADYMLPVRAGRGVLCELYEILKHVVKESNLTN